MNKSTKVTLYALWKINSYTVTFDKNYLENNLCTNSAPFLTSSGGTVNVGILDRQVIENDEAIDGKSLEVTFDDFGGGVWSSFGVPAFEQGSTYTWSVYVKSSKNTRINIGSEWYGEKKVDLTTEWQRFTHTFTVTGNPPPNRAFIFYAGYGTGSTWNLGDKLYVHSVELTKASSLNTTSVQKTYNSTLGTLSTPTREGYTFDGWYTAPSGGTKISSSTTVPAGDVTYYAHWKINNYMVTFDKNYLENNLAINASNPNNYSKSSYLKSSTIIGNNSAIDGKILEFTGADKFSGIYFPMDELNNGETYTWSVYVKSDTPRDKFRLGHEQKGGIDINLSTEWQRFTHTFTAKYNYGHHAFVFYTWSKEVAGNEVVWSEDSKLYIHSLEVSKTSSLNVTTAIKKYNETLGTLSTPTREGYTFDGWYTNPVGGTKIDSNTSVTSDVTYYAHWKYNG